jgi:hypothetical protein
MGRLRVPPQDLSACAETIPSVTGAGASSGCVRRVRAFECVYFPRAPRDTGRHGRLARARANMPGSAAHFGRRGSDRRRRSRRLLCALGRQRIRGVGRGARAVWTRTLTSIHRRPLRRSGGSRVVGGVGSNSPAERLRTGRRFDGSTGARAFIRNSYWRLARRPLRARSRRALIDGRARPDGVDLLCARRRLFAARRGRGRIARCRRLVRRRLRAPSRRALIDGRARPGGVDLLCARRRLIAARRGRRRVARCRRLARRRLRARSRRALIDRGARPGGVDLLCARRRLIAARRGRGRIAPGRCYSLSFRHRPDGDSCSVTG